MTYKNFAVLNVLSDPVILCSLVILCPTRAGTGCSQTGLMRHQITPETAQWRAFVGKSAAL